MIVTTGGKSDNTPHQMEAVVFCAQASLSTWPCKIPALVNGWFSSQMKLPGGMVPSMPFGVPRCCSSQGSPIRAFRWGEKRTLHMSKSCSRTPTVLGHPARPLRSLKGWSAEHCGEWYAFYQESLLWCFLTGMCCVAFACHCGNCLTSNQTPTGHCRRFAWAMVTRWWFMIIAACTLGATCCIGSYCMVTVGHDQI